MIQRADSAIAEWSLSFKSAEGHSHGDCASAGTDALDGSLATKHRIFAAFVPTYRSHSHAASQLGMSFSLLADPEPIDSRHVRNHRSLSAAPIRRRWKHLSDIMQW